MRYLVDFGSSSAGFPASFLVLKRLDTLADLYQPAITETAGGKRYYDLDWSVIGSPPSVVGKMLCNGVEQSFTLYNPGSSVIPTRYVLDFGMANTGGVPTPVQFADVATLSALTAPAAVEIGYGLYYFPFLFSSVADSVQSVSYKYSLGGVEDSGVISRSDGNTGYTTGTVTLADLRLLAQERADMVNSQFVSDAEWLRYINGSYQRLYGILSEKFEDYNISTSSFAADGVADRYPVPGDLFKLRGVDMQQYGTPTGWVTLKPFNLAERNRVLPRTVAVAGPWTTAIRYRLNGANLWLAPLPPASQMFRVHYTPRPSLLSSDSDVLDGVNGWEEYVVVDAARKALLKEESDTSGLERELSDLIQRIEHEAANRDAGEPATVSDVARGGYDLPDSWWPV